MNRKFHIWLVVGILINILYVRPSHVSADSSTRYDIGSPTFTDYWVDAINGNDANNGINPSSAFRTLTAAWNSIPQNTDLITGIRVNIQPGTYTASMTPNYWENRYGTFGAPILIRGNGTSREQVKLTGGVNMYNSHYIYFENLSIKQNGDTFHCEICDHILLRNMVFDGGAQQAQETIKFNQSQYVFIEDSEISGAWDNAIDFVAVQYGHIVNNDIHNAGDWCAYAKGGSAYLLVEGNKIHDCGTGGFTAGQGTGFQFMSPPWIQYEAYDIKIVNNLIYDIEGAGLGVNGGYNILMAYNTLYRVGSRSHVLEVVFGMRSCDGQPGEPGREQCQEHLNQGGWGTILVDNGSNHINIPNQNVYIYNNIIYNPPGFQSQWSHFAIYDQRSNPNNSSNAGPNPATTDANLQIMGNIIWNGDETMPLGIEDNLDACIPSDPCNETQLRADNVINTIQPQFSNPAFGDFRPTGTWTDGINPVGIPDFTWGLGGVSAGDLSNSIAEDYELTSRAENNIQGAVITVLETTVLSFTSNAAQDGWILESSETSNNGGSMNSTASTLNLGDNVANKQYRGILSFNTFLIPENATITSVTLKFQYAGKTGTLPFSTHGNLLVDIRKGSFGNDQALQLSDFKASVNKRNLLTFTNTRVSNWYTQFIDPADFQYINLANVTQFRLRFQTDDNNDSGTDMLRIYSGNAGVASRPQLIIEFYTP